MELLLAATILSVLFVGLGAHMRGGVLVWRRTTDGLEALQRRRVALDRLADDLANAVRFSDAAVEAPPIATQFGASELAFVTVDRGHGARTPSLRFVTYRCADDEDEGGPGLRRTSRTLAQARMDEAPEPQPLLEGCTALRLRYGSDGADGLVWQETWDYPDELPQVIEAQFEFGEGVAPLRQMLTVPAGTIKPAEGG